MEKRFKFDWTEMIASPLPPPNPDERLACHECVGWVNNGQTAHHSVPFLTSDGTPDHDVHLGEW